jgi:hypothetical protein
VGGSTYELLYYYITYCGQENRNDGCNLCLNCGWTASADEDVCVYFNYCENYCFELNFILHELDGKLKWNSMNILDGIGMQRYLGSVT